jgi:hypothetical protein
MDRSGRRRRHAAAPVAIAVVAAVGAAFTMSTGVPARRAWAAEADKNEADLGGVDLAWGTGVQVLRYRGERRQLCRPEPCIESHIQVAPISPAAWIYLGHKGLTAEGVRFVELVFMGGFTVQSQLTDVQDLYVGAGLGLLNRYLVIGVSVDLWRNSTERPQAMPVATGLFQGTGPGPGGFRWRENGAFFFAVDLLTMLRPEKQK